MNKTLITDFQSMLDELSAKADKLRRDFDAMERAADFESEHAETLKRSAVICHTVQKYIAAGCGIITAISAASEELCLSPAIVEAIFDFDQNFKKTVEKRANFRIIEKMTAQKYTKKAIARVIGCSEKYLYDLLKQGQNCRDKVPSCAITG